MNYIAIKANDKAWYRPCSGVTKTQEISACVGSIDIETSEYVRQRYKNMILEILGLREKQSLLQCAKDWIILILNRWAEMYTITGRLYIWRLIKSMLLQNTQPKRSTNTHDYSKTNEISVLLVWFACLVIDRVYGIAIIAGVSRLPFRNRISLEAVTKEVYGLSLLRRISAFYQQSDDIFVRLLSYGV